MRECGFLSTILSLYGRIPVTENAHFAYFMQRMKLNNFFMILKTGILACFLQRMKLNTFFMIFQQIYVWDEGSYSQTTTKWDLKEFNKFF